MAAARVDEVTHERALEIYDLFVSWLSCLHFQKEFHYMNESMTRLNLVDALPGQNRVAANHHRP